MFLRRFVASVTVTRASMDGGYYNTDQAFVGAEMGLHGGLISLECDTWEMSGMLQPIESDVDVEITFAEDLTEPTGPEIIDGVEGVYAGQIQMWTGEGGSQKPIGQQKPEGLIHALVMIVLPIAMFPILYSMKDERIQLKISRDFKEPPLDLKALGVSRLVGLVKRVEFETEPNQEDKKRRKFRISF